ncbi:MAG: epoxyqueuosine reductase [Spirochaetales bacterium]|nr:epoxyqueuosine reductase [Spirochaetales bacterium]
MQSIKTTIGLKMNSKEDISEYFRIEGFSSPRFLKNPEGPGTVIIAAFPVRIPVEKAPKGLRIAPFAAANHYGEAVLRMKRISGVLREKTGMSKSDIRLFCNSTLEEKRFAALSGLGFTGRNSLVITREWGSRVILAGMIIPFETETDSPLENGSKAGALCGSCRRCMAACPTGAIESSGVVNRDKCLQSLTTDSRRIPEWIMEKWGNRLYGCTICQDVCPFNKNVVSPEPDGIAGDLGMTLSFEEVLVPDDPVLKKSLKGTALGMSWITAENLKRNAMISASFCRNRIEAESLIPLVEPYTGHPVISYAAIWSLKRLRKTAGQQESPLLPPVYRQ